MPGRGSQTFKKRQKEQERKERQQEKMVKRLEKKNNPRGPEEDAEPEEGTPVMDLDSDQQDVSVA